MAHQKEYSQIYCSEFMIYLVHAVLLLAPSEFFIVAAKGSNYYTAAVFEHVRYEDLSKSPQEMIKRNLDIYSMATKAAAQQETDIIVFPEWGLYRLDKTNRSSALPFAEDIPDPRKEYCNPCVNQDLFQDRPVLLHLSCLARDNALYLVANMADLKKCVPDETCDTLHCSLDPRRCPPDVYKLFNTNVVFNRKGDLVSRYYKAHLYFQPNFNVPAYPEPAYFETDFGSFTTFICFDIGFREAVEAVKRKGVTNVAFPTFWYDHLPLQNAVQYQQAWAIANRVNLLAANAHRPGTGTIGSGIYSGTKGALVYTFNPDGDSKLLISKVPIAKDFPEDFKTDAKVFRIRDGKVKDISGEKHDSKVPEQCSRNILGPSVDMNKEYRCNELNTTEYSFKKLEKPTGSLEVCQNGICCNLSYSADSMAESFYLGVHSGISWIYNTYGFCVEVCMLIRCDTQNENESCSTYPLISKTRFRSLSLSSNFTSPYVYPSVVKNKMALVSTQEWKCGVSNGEAQITFSPKSKESGFILAVGLHGRCYDKDPLSSW